MTCDEVTDEINVLMYDKSTLPWLLIFFFFGANLVALQEKDAW